MKYNLTLLAIIVIGIASLSTSTVFCQTTPKAVEGTNKCSAEKFIWPDSISKSEKGFLEYLQAITLPVKDRGKAFNALTYEQKANFIRFQFAMQLVKHPNLSKDQIEFLVGEIKRTTSDALETKNAAVNYEKTGYKLSSGAISVFGPSAAGSVLNGIFEDKSDELKQLQKYDDVLNHGMYERRTLVAGLPLAERADIWKAQLAYHLATATLTNEQSLFIAKAIQIVSPMIMSASKMSKEEKIKASEDFRQAGLKVFTMPEFYSVFMGLGIQRQIKDKPSLLSRNQQMCQCNYYCDGNASCQSNTTCIQQDICGVFGTSTCEHPCYTN